MNKQIQVGDTVRINGGFLWHGFIGTVTGISGDVCTVEFTAPKYLLGPNLEQETKRLPYASAELIKVEA